jgi:hypothetical protein
MVRKIDVERLRNRSIGDIDRSIARFSELCAKIGDRDFLLIRWSSAMTAVEIHGIWERFVEERLVSLINHNPSHFANQADIKGLTRVSSGLARYIIRGGGRYFDFRSMSELLQKADSWLGKENNPFRALPPRDREYVDVLSAIRNCVVHGSDAAQAAYRRNLRIVYGVKSAPEPEEFLNAIDFRKTSPARKEKRLKGIAAVVRHAINST